MSEEKIVEKKIEMKEEEEKTPRMERENVHDVYQHIADHFSGTRYKGWPLVDDFLNNLPLGSIVADVGCGNGKYLHVNSKNIAAIGCDRSSQLIGICGTRGLEAFVCDGLTVPFRDASFDAVISVAVIHHFSTPERRLQSIIELGRLLKPGGRMLVSVWAYEQKRFENEPSQDVFVKWSYAEPGKKKKDLPPDAKPVVYQRYYHLFKDGELNGLVEKIDSLRIEKYAWDRDNWYVTATKI